LIEESGVLSEAIRAQSYASFAFQNAMSKRAIQCG